MLGSWSFEESFRKLPASLSRTSPYHRFSSRRDNRNEQTLKVTRDLSLDPVGKVALVEVPVGRLALVHAVTTPVDHDDAANKGNILGASSGHGGFKHIRIML